MVKESVTVDADKRGGLSRKPAELAIASRQLPPGASTLLRRLAERSPCADAVYLSTPMTTGHLYLQWRREHMRSLSSADEHYAARLKREVLMENTSRLVPLRHLIQVSWPGRALIDPTSLDRPDWQQPDYHRFWVQVIRELVTTMVLADGWQYSSGCAVEAACAYEKGIEVLDARLNPLGAALAAGLLRTAAEEISHAYQSPAPTLSAAAAIARV